MAGSVSIDASALLAALQTNLARLVEARDPQTAELAYELQNIIDKVQADLGPLEPMSVGARAASTFQEHRKLG